MIGSISEFIRKRPYPHMAIIPLGFSTLCTSWLKASRSNQCTACATVIKSKLSLTKDVCSALCTLYSILSLWTACRICCLLISLANTCAKDFESTIATCPFPVPQSQQVFLALQKEYMYLNSSSG